MTTKIRYDYEFLQQFCKENGIVLTKDYSLEKVNRDTIIEAKCLTEGCQDICSKKFDQIKIRGCYCKKCIQINRIQKQKQTCLKIYGVENISQLQEIKKQKKETTLKNYGVESPLQSEEIKEKTKNTCMDKYGVENPNQNKEVREKTNKTCLEKYGGFSPMCNIEIQNKSKVTCLINYGVESPLQSEEIKEKTKNTCMDKYGVKFALQAEEVKTQSKITIFKKYGVENISQNEEIKNQKKETTLKNYGVESPFQMEETKLKNKIVMNEKSEEIKQKKIETSLKNWGTEHPAQNAEVSEKASKNAYKAYDYIFPSGRIERIQGYEKFTLNDLLQKEGILEDDIVVKRSDVPSVWYEDASKKKRRYFVDCFIKSQNRCIEAKSTWTAAKKKDCIYLKQQALKDAGYKCEIWIYNGNGELMEKIY
jgi:hypothetical protein